MWSEGLYERLAEGLPSSRFPRTPHGRRYPAKSDRPFASVIAARVASHVDSTCRRISCAVCGRSTPSAASCKRFVQYVATALMLHARLDRIPQTIQKFSSSLTDRNVMRGKVAQKGRQTVAKNVVGVCEFSPPPLAQQHQFPEDTPHWRRVNLPQACLLCSRLQSRKLWA